MTEQHRVRDGKRARRTRVERLVFFQATCPCGWKGKKRWGLNAERDAGIEGAMHENREHGAMVL